MSFSVLSRAAARLLRPLRRVLAPVFTLLAPLLGCALAAPAAPLVAPPVPAQPPIEMWQSIVLGLVQGLTEFIPVSSSAHLNIAHKLMGHPRQLTLDVFLSIGTTVALVWYFRHDWKELLTVPRLARLRNLVFISCIPAAIAGALLRGLEDKYPLFADIRFNAAMLAIAGTILLISDRVGTQKRSLEAITLKDALIIGASQAVALIPGVSRSGSTLTAGLFLGLQRADAARFSFLMSLPITLGAIAFEFRGFLKEGGVINASYLTIGVGILTAGISGLWAIGFLLNYLKTKDVTPFFLWRVAVALFVFGLILTGLLRLPPVWKG